MHPSNRDVSLRLDLKAGTGTLYLLDNPLAELKVRALSEDLIELVGSGEAPLVLDLDRQAIYFESGEAGVFCRARIYRGGS